MELETRSPAETEAVGAAIAARLRVGDVVLLTGEIGSGKTTLVRGAARAVGVTSGVSSPTFTIGHRYPGDPDVSHLDLYRFHGLAPAEWGDLEPYFDHAVVFVEWPEAGATALPPARLAITLVHGGGDRRLLILSSADSALLQGIADARPGLRHGD